MTGDTLCHSDLRDDNLIVTADGALRVCDWNWPAVGPAWTDTVCVAIAMYGDGLEAEALLAETGLLLRRRPGRGGQPVGRPDGVLPALVGRAGQPDLALPAGPPAWYAEATGAWLEQRRGWA